MRLLLLTTVSWVLSLSVGIGQSISDAETEKSRHEQWMEDIEFFETEFVDQARTLSPESRITSKAILEDLRGDIDSLSDIQIHLELTRCVVLAEEGHTDITVPKMGKIPMRFYHFSDGWYVIKTDSSSAGFLGGKVLSINSIPIDEIEQRLFPYLAGIESWKRYAMMLLLPAPQLYYELGMGEEDSMTLELMKDGQRLTANMAARPMEESIRWYQAWANL
ncbi:MAG: hypothetical protein AAFQ98_22310, partial [Bacteroidota bacterium]